LGQNTTYNKPEYSTPYCPNCLKKGIQVETKYFYIENLKPIALHCMDCDKKLKEIYEEAELQKAKDVIIRQKSKILPLSDIGSKYKKSSFSKFNGYVEGLNDCNLWAKNFRDKVLDDIAPKFSLYLYGASGCGKTELQACVYNDLEANGKNCLFTTLGKLFECMHDYDKVKVSDVYQLIKSLDALFIDDFGAGELNRKSRDWLFEIFDICDKYEIPVFISSNINKGDDILLWISGENITDLEIIRAKRLISRLLSFKRRENRAGDYRPILSESLQNQELKAEA